MDKKVIGIIVALVVIIGGVAWWGVESGKKANAPAAEVSGTVYFYGAECPHCKTVNEFLEKEKIAEKVQFSKKEVWHDQGNAAEMMQAAKQCGLDPKKIGVPFIFDNGTCKIGEPDVKKFFTEKAGIKE
jgi:glutaredoxin